MPYREPTREEEANYAEAQGALRHQRQYKRPTGPSQYREPTSTDEEELEHSEAQGAVMYPHQRTMGERARGVVSGAVKAVTVAGQVGHAVAQGARDASRMTGVDQYAARMNAPRGTPRSARHQEQYQNVPASVGQTSTIHPGNKLYVIEGRILAATSGAPKQRPPQQGRSVRPGFSDSLFGGDNGL